MSDSNAATVEQRLSALEKDVETLHEAYKDVAYTQHDTLIARIEAIRAEVNASLDAVIEDARTAASEKITTAVKVAQQQLSAEAIASHVIPALTDGTHVLVVRNATLEEHRTGKGIPFKQAPHKG